MERILEHIAKCEPMELLYYPTVWFNAWKFTEEGQIWAALASEIINQLNSKPYALLTRLQFWFQLNRKRAKLLPAMGRILLNLLVIVILALATVLYPSFIHPFIISLFPTQGTVSGAASTTATVVGFALFLATALEVIRTAYKIAKAHPFQISINSIIQNPDYQEKIGYISQFSEDFKRIVSVATRRSSAAWEAQKLVLLIDDLDRCRPLQAVGIIEAISLFFDSEQCVFMLGMDADAVKVSIEARYKELTERFHHDKPEVVSLGKFFLEKIIQISLNIPQARLDQIDRLVTTITQGSRDNGVKSTLLLATLDETPSMAPSDAASEAALAAQQTVRAYFAGEEVQDAIRMASFILKHNPRRIKQFINLFRLKVFFLNRVWGEWWEHPFGEGGEGLRDFARMLAWSVQWSEVATLVVYSPHSAEVCSYLLYLCKMLQNDPQAFDAIINDHIVRRKKMKKFPAHWCFLPWEEWIYDDDFRYCIDHFRDQWQLKSVGEFVPLLESVRL